MKRLVLIATIICSTLCVGATRLYGQVTVTTVHKFTGPDGASPRGPLVKATDGNFYGTTALGGSGVTNPFGTVFRVSPNGTFTSLYSFSFQVTGDEPYAGVIQASDGNFYGTTRGTGSYNGNLFRLTPAGAFTELHAFGGFFFGDDGAHPFAELLQASDGNLYGTTHDNSGGAGVIFKISPSGANFVKLINLPGGANTYSPLIEGPDGNLYGTTYNGGAAGRGSIFRISKSGAYSTLYEYTFAANEGRNPMAGLFLATDGNFYGTTSGGGTHGGGTVFRISPSGNYATLYSFEDLDGSDPEAGVIQATDGNFYGTTRTGGQFHAGTVFRITPAGTFTSLYSFRFTGTDEGYLPESELIQGSDGAFYGTTVSGSSAADKGAVFRLAIAQPTPSIQFSAAAYAVGEGDGRATVTITRTNDTSGTSSVDIKTADSDTFTVGCADATGANGAAYGRCDFATLVSTVTFAAGETQKQLTIPIIDDAHVEGAQTFQLILSNPVVGSLGVPNVATITIQDNDSGPATNPIFASPFFVRQHYLDFLSREPDDAGFNAWLSVLNGCSDVNNNPNCDRILVSQSFFGSPEFQLKGFYVFRFYKLAFNRLPEYLEIIPDMSFVAGTTAAEVFARKAQLATSFTGRSEFTSIYGAKTNAEYVALLLGRYQLTQITTPDPAHPDDIAKLILTQADLTNALNASSLTRAQVFRAIADSDQVSQAEFNKAFVAMQYYGYLRRKPEEAGYQAWLAVLQSGDIRTMVSGFMNSQEYRLRFGNPIP